MLQTMKRLLVLLPALLLIANILAACQTKDYQYSGSSQPLGDVVGQCNEQFLPTITTMTSPKPSSQIIYFISGIHLYAFNAGNGKLRWCVRASRSGSHLSSTGNIVSLLIGPQPLPDGFTAMTVNKSTVYACSEDDYTYAFDANSGSLLWHHNTGFANTSAPTVVNGVVYVGSGTVYALDEKDGSERWKYATQDVVTSSPVVVNGVVYLGSYGDRIYALDAATGSQRWEYPTGGRVYVDPVVANGTVFFGAGDDGPTLYAINTQDGKLRWHNSMLISSSLAITNDILYVGANNYLYALNAQDGTVRWRYPIATPLNPLVVNNVIYVSSTNGMYALNVSDGTLRWHKPLNTMSAGTTTVPVMINDELYVGTIDLGDSGSKAMIHALNASTGIEDWSASVPWNVSTIDVAA